MGQLLLIVDGLPLGPQAPDRGNRVFHRQPVSALDTNPSVYIRHCVGVRGLYDAWQGGQRGALEHIEGIRHLRRQSLFITGHEHIRQHSGTCSSNERYGCLCGWAFRWEARERLPDSITEDPPQAQPRVRAELQPLENGSCSQEESHHNDNRERRD